MTEAMVKPGGRMPHRFALVLTPSRDVAVMTEKE
jgi:hypothetical protein